MGVVSGTSVIDTGQAMARVSFTDNLQRHLAVAELTVSGDSVRQVFAQVFIQSPRLQGYLLDDQGRLRQHVAVFVDGQQIRDRTRLTDPVCADSEIYVVQALSGG